MTDIKEEVRRRYAGIAGGGGSCCEPARDQTIPLVDYRASGLSVEGDLGLGCGTPTLTAAVSPGEVVLDLGSGAGVDVFLAAREVGPEGRVIGVDMTPEMIQRARHNAAAGGYDNVEFHLGDIEALPVADGSVDLILSNCVINLAPDKEAVFAEMHRVLAPAVADRPAGRFSVSDIVTFGPVPAEVRADVAAWTGCIAGAVDRERFLAMAAAAGFTDVTVVAETRYDEWGDGDWGVTSVTVTGRRA